MTLPQLRVDLDVLAANIEVVRARIAPAELMLVVKDDAYGHGLAPIVRRAAAEGVRWFGAFDVTEAVRTRAAAGAGARIFSWLTVGTDEIAEALAADIDLGVGDAGFLEAIASTVRAGAEPARVHLKIDSGLHRNGIRPEEWAAVVERARRFEDAGLVRVVGVWSHIAEASDDEDDAARSVFDDAVAVAETAGLRLEVRHLSASAASFARPGFRYDLARIGAFCYGIRSAGGVGEADLGVDPVAELVAEVTRVDGDEAVLGLGALHGLPSTLARHASLRIGGRRIAVDDIGLTHTLVGSWPGARAGATVAVFGRHGTSATDLAESIDSVGEEILVRVSPLVPRVYLGR
jgi:alanine racemase